MRILCVGEALVDLVCERPAASLRDAGSFAPRIGGAVAATAVIAARRGADVALAGGAGADPWGAWLAQRLQDEGVDLTWFARDADGGAATPLSFVTADADAAPTFTPHGAPFALPGDLDLAPAVDACDALLLSSSTLVGDAERAATLAARDRALATGKPLVLDTNLDADRWRSRSASVEVLGPLVDRAFLVVADTEDALALTGEREADAAARSLVAAGAVHALVTRGADGALLRGGGLDRDVRAVAATPVDRTGAGAAVTGVLLSALARTGFYPASIAAMLPDAMAEAARATERFGAVA